MGLDLLPKGLLVTSSQKKAGSPTKLQIRGSAADPPPGQAPYHVTRVTRNVCSPNADTPQRGGKKG